MWRHYWNPSPNTELFYYLCCKSQGIKGRRCSTGSVSADRQSMGAYPTYSSLQNQIDISQEWIQLCTTTSRPCILCSTFPKPHTPSENPSKKHKQTPSHIADHQPLGHIKKVTWPPVLQWLRKSTAVLSTSLTKHIHWTREMKPRPSEIGAMVRQGSSTTKISDKLHSDSGLD